MITTGRTDMKKRYTTQKPVKVDPAMDNSVENFALELFSEYANGSFDILIMNKSKNLLFLNDYIRTLDIIKANNTPYERFKFICDEELINSL